MNILISGGCKNGKSYYAQTVAKKMAEEQGKPLYYIATMIPRDEEDRARIKRHLEERDGWGFQTIEQGKHLLEILNKSEVDLSGVFLLDSVTAVLENEMFYFHEGDYHFDENAAQRVKEDCITFGKATGNTIFVSDGIYGDMGEYSQSTEEYRKGLALTDRAIAELCDRVIEIAYGQEEIWK